MSYQKFSKDLGIIGVVNLLVATRGIIILPIITKMMGAESYGAWTQVIITLSLASLFVPLRLPPTLIRFLSAEKNHQKIQDGIYSVFLAVLAISSIASLLLVSFSGFFADILNIQKAVIKILALTIILECLNTVFYSTFRLLDEVKKYSFFLLSQTFGDIAFVALATILKFGIIGIVSSLLITRLIVFLAMGALIVKRIGIKFPNFWDIRKYLNYSLPAIPGDISFWLVQSSDRYLIGFFLGIVFVGYYAPIYTIASVLNFFIAPFEFILPVFLSRLFDENKLDDLRNYLKYSLKYFLVIAIPSSFGLSILSKQLLTILSTREIAEHSFFITPFIVLSVLFYGLYAIIGQILFLKKKTKIIGIIWTIAGLLNIGLNLFAIPAYGLMGAAVTTLIGYLFACLMGSYFSFKNFRFDLDFAFILKSLTATFLMSATILFINPVSIISIIFSIILGSILYGLVLILLKAFEKKEFLLFAEIFRSLRL